MGGGGGYPWSHALSGRVGISGTRSLLGMGMSSCEKTMFSQVSVHRGSYPWSHVLCRGGYLWYQVPSGGWVYPEGVGMSGGWVLTAPPPPDTWDLGYYGIRSTSGRYACYWNAFLLLYVDIELLL